MPLGVAGEYSDCSRQYRGLTPQTSLDLYLQAVSRFHQFESYPYFDPEYQTQLNALLQKLTLTRRIYLSCTLTQSHLWNCHRSSNTTTALRILARSLFEGAIIIMTARDCTLESVYRMPLSEVELNRCPRDV